LAPGVPESDFCQDEFWVSTVIGGEELWQRFESSEMTKMTFFKGLTKNFIIFKYACKCLSIVYFGFLTARLYNFNFDVNGRFCIKNDYSCLRKDSIILNFSPPKSITSSLLPYYTHAA
jgi:hypothetical protein